MQVYFVRHGESEANILEVIANRGWKYGLTEKGRRQALDLAVRLKGEGVTDIFSSPLKRAVETADILGGELGLVTTITDGLREFDCGEMEGRGDPESWGVFRTVVGEWLEAGNLAARIPGGESYLDIRARFYAMVEEELIPEQNKPRVTVMVGHGMVFYLMLPTLFTNISYEFARHHRIGNTGYALGSISEEGWICREWFGSVPPGIPAASA